MGGEQQKTLPKAAEEEFDGKGRANDAENDLGGEKETIGGKWDKRHPR